MQCPHQDENYACHATITGQEIQAVSGLLNGGEQQEAPPESETGEREEKAAYMKGSIFKLSQTGKPLLFCLVRLEWWRFIDHFKPCLVSKRAIM